MFQYYSTNKKKIKYFLNTFAFNSG